MKENIKSDTMISTNDYHRRLNWNKSSGTGTPTHPVDKQFRQGK